MARWLELESVRKHRAGSQLSEHEANGGDAHDGEVVLGAVVASAGAAEGFEPANIYCKRSLVTEVGDRPGVPRRAVSLSTCNSNAAELLIFLRFRNSLRGRLTMVRSCR